MLEKSGFLRLYSLNPLYEPYELPVSEIKEVWKFIHYISSELPEPALPQDALLKTVASLKDDMNRVKNRLFVGETGKAEV